MRKLKGLANPSGPLIKAALINSCTSLNGAVSLDGSDSFVVALGNKDTPNKYEGFGAIGLSNILEFDDSTFILDLFDRQEITGGGVNVHCYSTNSRDTNSFLKATIAWYDAPNQANSVPTLYSDLDMIVTVFEDGKMSKRVFANGLTEKDSQNNVERVTITGFDSSSIIMVKVTAEATTQTQKYGLVLTRSKSMKLEDSSVCMLLDKTNSSISIVTIGVLLTIGFVAFCLLSVLCLGACICCCVLRKTTSLHVKVQPTV